MGEIISWCISLSFKYFQQYFPYFVHSGVNPQDFRGWYGLGQTYELLNMPYYSLYYFKEAQKLRYVYSPGPYYNMI